MAIFNYQRFKIAISPESKRTQGLQVGDVVRRQYGDGGSVVYSLLIVLETGVDVIRGNESAYFVGALMEGDEPKTGELLNFVRVTNLFNGDRSGAMYLTASDSDAPYLDVIDGLAVEGALCYPYLGDGDPEWTDKSRYSCLGSEFFSCSYVDFLEGQHRVFRLTRNSVDSKSKPLGIKQRLEDCPAHPARVVVSYKVRASKGLKGVPVSFGYPNGREFDGKGVIDVGTDWEYRLMVVTIDFPVIYERSFFIDLTGSLSDGDWFEISDLNIVPLSAVATLSEGTKVRIGKVEGVVDPLFGVLDGFGAYFQNLYATGNVNVAGTLTAGDEHGFASTFYVGRIHKNVLLNSVDCAFNSDISNVLGRSFVGIGRTWRFGQEVNLVAQTDRWRGLHVDERFCFSFWARSYEGFVLRVYQDEHFIGKVAVDGADWKRYYVPFVVGRSAGPELCLRMLGGSDRGIFCAPQLEAGDRPTAYQPTDERLSDTDEYGAWFSQGGIGGTIQNPLLRLNGDGSISSRDGSFVIKPDGTGYFADGRFAWSKDEITLRDVTIKWKDLDEEGKEMLLPITAEIRSHSGLVVKNEDGDIDVRVVLFRGGEEIDVSGSEYEYRWKLWDAAGENVLREYEGKEIVVGKGEFEDKGVLEYEILE